MAEMSNTLVLSAGGILGATIIRPDVELDYDDTKFTSKDIEEMMGKGIRRQPRA